MSVSKPVICHDHDGKTVLIVGRVAGMRRIWRFFKKVEPSSNSADVVHCMDMFYLRDDISDHSIASCISCPLQYPYTPSKVYQLSTSWPARAITSNTLGGSLSRIKPANTIRSRALTANSSLTFSLVAESKAEDRRFSRCCPQQVMVHISRLPTLRATTAGSCVKACALARMMLT